jgi:MerR family copper efflux transcriptional regulator
MSPQAQQPITFRIGDLAKATGKTARALRLYEEMGLLTPGTRTSGGFRVYGQDAIERVRWISKQQDLGFTLNEIQDLIGTALCPGVPKQAMAEVRRRYAEKLTALDAQMERLADLRGELIASLDYLEGCTSCGHTHHGLRACLTCDEHQTRAPTLVVGVTEGARAESNEQATAPSGDEG